MEPRKEAKSPFDRSAFYNNYIVYFEKPETELVEIDGHKRTVYQLGVFKKDTFIRITLTPEQLGMTGMLQQLPLNVYIQVHAIDRLKELIEINPAHTQGQLLLGIALMSKGEKKQAKEQFLKVKDMDKDPSVQATVDSYLQDLK